MQIQLIYHLWANLWKLIVMCYFALCYLSYKKSFSFIEKYVIRFLNEFLEFGRVLLFLQLVADVQLFSWARASKIQRWRTNDLYDVTAFFVVVWDWRCWCWAGFFVGKNYWWTQRSLSESFQRMPEISVSLRNYLFVNICMQSSFPSGVYNQQRSK